MAASPTTRFLALALSIGSFTILQSLLVPVLPLIQADFHTDTAGVTWVITAWFISAAVATPILGRVGDLIGRRRTFLIALGAIAVGSILASLAPSLVVLIIARVIQGAGGAIFPLAFALARDAFEPKRIAAMIGALSAIIAVGSGLGTVLAGPVTDLFGWRGLFMVPLALTIVGGILAIIALPAPTARGTGRINALSALLLSGWLVALLLPLSNGPEWGWGSPAVVILFVVALVLLIAWILHETRTRSPLVDMHIMRLPAIWPMNAASVLFGAAMFGVFVFFARFTQEPTSTGYGLGMSVGEAGLLILPMLVTMALAGVLSGWLTVRVTPRAQVIGGSLLLALSSASLALFHSELWQVTIAVGVFGIGLGVAFAAMTNVIVQGVPGDQVGIATGMNTNLRNIGSSIGVAIMTAVITASTGASGQPSEGGYVAGFLTVSAFSTVAAIVVLLARRPSADQRTTAPAEVPATSGAK
jgi:EmrB/QacA subfamily drug resistance transporter